MSEAIPVWCGSPELPKHVGCDCLVKIQTTSDPTYNLFRDAKASSVQDVILLTLPCALEQAMLTHAYTNLPHDATPLCKILLRGARVLVSWVGK